MSHVRYFILRVAGRWHVTLEGHSMSDHPTRSDAVKSATVMADLMGTMGHDADVMIEIGAGLPLELVWTYGQDEVAATRAIVPVPEPEPELDLEPHIRLVQRGEAA